MKQRHLIMRVHRTGLSVKAVTSGGQQSSEAMLAGTAKCMLFIRTETAIER